MLHGLRSMAGCHPTTHRGTARSTTSIVLVISGTIASGCVHTEDPQLPPHDTQQAITVPANCVPPRFDVGVTEHREPPPALAQYDTLGSTDLTFIVEVDGSVRTDSIRVQRSSGDPKVDKAAARFVASNRFLPGRCDGMPQTLPILYRVTFQTEHTSP